MQPKKNEKVDLTKNSSLYFVIGLSIVLLITWQTIEWKTYKKTYDYEALNCLLYTSPSPRDEL